MFISEVYTSDYIYRKMYNVRDTEFQNLNDFRLVLYFLLPNPLKPVLSCEMEM